MMRLAGADLERKIPRCDRTQNSGRRPPRVTRVGKPFCKQGSRSVENGQENVKQLSDRDNLN